MARRSMKSIMLFSAAAAGLATLGYTGSALGATTVYSDDFNRAALNGGTYTYTVTPGATDGGASIASSTTLTLTNDATAAANTSGRTSVSAATSAFTGFNQKLDSNSGTLTWAFNMRFGRTGNTPSGFTSASYGNAFILGGTSSDFGAGSGYALIFGNNSSPDTFRFVNYSSGILTDITGSNSAGNALVTGSGAFSVSTQAASNDYYSFNITYNTSTHLWTVKGRDDGSSAFADPSAGSFTTLGTVTDSTYTNTTLTAMGALWSYATAASQSTQFDNFSLVDTPAVVTAANVVWAAASGTWDAATANWTGGTPTAGLYKDGDNATFDNTATGGNITIVAGGVSPNATTVNNDSSHPYTFKNTGGDTNGIKTGSLTKSGNGTLTLTGQNTYAGGTAINGGTIIIDADNELGASAGGITFGNGTLKTVAGITSTRSVSLTSATSSVYDTSGFTSTIGGISGNGTLTVQGAGSLTAASIAGVSNIAVTGNTAMTANAAITQTTGTLTVAAGSSLTFDYAGSTRSTLTGGTINGILAFKTGTPRIDFNTGTILGSGTIQIQQAGTLISNTSGILAGTVNPNIALNSTQTTGDNFTRGNVTAGTYVAGNFTTTIGGTKATSPAIANLIINGVISGYSDVNIANNSSTGGGGGEITFNAANTYHGVTLINAGTPDVAGTASITLGINNALPTDTDVIFGTLTGVGAPVLDMAGHNQQIASISDGGSADSTHFLTIKNNGNTDSVLTVSGSSTPGNGFGGVIADGATNKIALNKSGSNTLKLSGASTYSGDTNVTGGKLQLASGSSILNSNVTVDGASAVLEIGGSGDVNKLGDDKTLTLADGATVILSFSGYEHIGSILIDGNLFTQGIFSADTNPDIFSGAGTIAVPEPTSAGLISIAAAGLLARRRRSRKA